MSKHITRRSVLKGTVAAVAAGTVVSPALLEWARAWAAEMPFKPEAGAKIRMLRWNRFVESEDIQFDKNIAAFTAATGIEVRLDKEFIDDIQPKAATAAFRGAGPDVIWGTQAIPHLLAEKLLDVTDVANYLGEKYGGWYDIPARYCNRDGRWMALPLCIGGNYINYRIKAVSAAGYDKFPDNTDDFMKLSVELKRAGIPGGMALGHATGDGNAFQRPSLLQSRRPLDGAAALHRRQLHKLSHKGGERRGL